MATLPDIREAHDARIIAADLIRNHHPHLLDANILYLFTDQRRKRCDRVRIGSAGKMTALQRFLSSGHDSVQDGEDFVILLDSAEWVVLSATQRAALIDHELCHCGLFVKVDQTWRLWGRQEDGDPGTFEENERRWGLRAHDIEEFSEVIARHGFWKPAEQERAFEAIVLQLRIPDATPNGNGATPKVTTSRTGRQPASA